MGWFSSNSESDFPWIHLTETQQLLDQVQQADKPVLVFKHSTRCSISKLALSKFEKNMPAQILPCFYLDLLNYRSISNDIAAVSKVVHQSPQVIVWKNNQVIYQASHSEIDPLEILKLF